MVIDPMTGNYIDRSTGITYNPKTGIITDQNAGLILNLNTGKLAPIHAGSVSTQGIFGATLKGLKALGQAIRSGGWLISQALKLVSKEKAELFRKWSSKIADALEKVESASKEAVTKALIAVRVPFRCSESINRYHFRNFISQRQASIYRGLLDFSIGAMTLQKISIFWKIIFIILLCILVAGSIGLFVGLNFLLLVALSKIPLLGIEMKTNSAGLLFSVAIVIFSPFNLVIGFILEVIKGSVFKGREVYKNIFDMITTYLVTYLFIYILDYYLADIAISHFGIAALTLCYTLIFELYEYYEPLINRWNKKNQDP